MRGQNEDFERRARAHKQRGSGKEDLVMEKVATGLTERQARDAEQALVILHGLKRDGGILRNKINSISPRKRDYAERVERGKQSLRDAGYRHPKLRPRSGR